MLEKLRLTESFIITGKLSWATAIAATEAITKMALYYFHERIWNRVDWGQGDD